MKNNKIILALLVIICIMAIGFSAFTSKLSINGSSSAAISWNIHFDETKANSYEITTGSLKDGLGVKPNPGSISFSDNGLSASISPKLNQPGDKITYNFTVINDGSLNAKLSEGYPVLIVDGKTLPSGTLSYTTSRINITISNIPEKIKSKTIKGSGTDDFQVDVSYPDNGLNSKAENHTFKILLNYIQE